MSDVDNRVVSLEFDNQRFESNVKTSMGTIQKLNGVLDNLDKMDFSGIETAIRGMSQRLSTAGIAAASFVENITNRVTNSAIQMAKSLTFGNISSGFANYETELKSVQNIINATGDKIETVEAQLDRIRSYSDETSYSYAKLVGTISAFTSQDISLEDSTDAIMGVANILGLAGVEAEKADHAFTGFARAMAAGMNGQTWAYIHTAAADTAQTEKIFMDAAVAVGTLEKTEEGLYKTTQKAKKAGQEVNTANFDQTFSFDWFTPEVLTYAFKDMGSYNKLLDTFIGQYENLFDETITVSEAMELLDNSDKSKTFDSKTVEAYAQAMSELNGTTMSTSEALKELQTREQTLSEKGYKAGQAYRTFADTINATKTAISSAFAGIFKSMFGNAEQARETWTEVGGWLYDIFADPFVSFDKMLKNWANGPGRQAFIEGFFAMGNSIVDIVFAIREGFTNIIPAVTVDDVNRLAENFKALSDRLTPTEEQLEKISNISEDLGRIVVLLKDNLKSIGSSISTAFKNIVPKATLDSLKSLSEKIASTFESFKINSDISGKLTSAFEGLFAILDTIRLAFSSLFRVIGENIPAFQSLGSAILDGASDFGQYFKAIHDGLVQNDSFYNGFKKIIDLLGPAFQMITKAASIAFNAIKKFLGVDLANSSMEEFTSNISATFEAIMKPLAPLKALIEGVYSALSAVLGFAVSAVTKIGSFFTNLSTHFQNMVARIIAELKILSTQLQSTLGNFDLSKGAALLFAILTGNISWNTKWMTKGLKGIRELFSVNLANGFQGLIGKIKSGIEDFGAVLEGLEEVFSKTKDSFMTFLGTFQDTQMTTQIRNMAVSLLMLAAAMWIIASIEPENLGQGFAGLAVAFSELLGAVAVFKGMFKDFKVGIKDMAELATLSTIFIGLAAACLLLAIGMKILAGVPFEDLVSSAFVLVISLGIMAGILRILAESTKGLIPAAAALVMVAIAALLLVAAIGLLAIIPMEGMFDKLLALAVAFGIVVAALIILGKVMQKSIGSLIAAAGAILIVSVAVLFLAVALAALAMVPADSITSSMESLAIIILILTFSLMILGSVGPMVIVAALAILIFSAALLLFGPALLGLAAGVAMLQSLGPIQIKPFLSLAVGLIALAIAGAFLLAGGPGLLMGAKALVNIGTALTLMNGTGAAAQGLSFLLLALGLTALAVAGVALLAGGAGLIMGGKALVSIGAALALMKGTGVAAQGLGFIVLAFGLLFLSAAGIALLPGAAGLALAGAALMTLSGPLLILSGIDIPTLALNLILLAGGLAGLAGAGIILIPGAVGLLLTGAALLVIGTGFAAAKAAINGISDIDLSNTVSQLKSLGDTIKDFKSVAKDFKKAASDIQKGLSIALSDSVSAIDTAGYTVVGMTIAEQIAFGMTSNPKAIFDAGRNVVINSMTEANSAASEWNNVGVNICAGIAAGIGEGSEVAISAIGVLADSLITEFQARMQIKSPSRVMLRLSKYIPMGVGQGIQNGTYYAVESMNSFGNSLVASAQDVTERIVYAMNLDNIDPITPVSYSNSLDDIFGPDFTEPEITPHLDLTRANQQVSALQNLMSSIDGNNVITVTHKFEDLTVRGVNNEGELKAVTTTRIEEELASSMRRMYRI